MPAPICGELSLFPFFVIFLGRSVAQEDFTHLVHTASLFEDSGVMPRSLDGEGCGHTSKTASYYGDVALLHTHRTLLT